MLLSKPELVKLAVEIATQSGLDPALVCAHIDVRSKWDSGYSQPSAIHYLPRPEFPDPPESEHRSILWGLMAIGGEFARAEGYQLPLPSLLSPRTNVEEGCRLMLRMQVGQSDPVHSAVESLTHWNRENSRELAALTLSKLEAYRELIARIPEAPHTFPDADSSLLLTHSQISSNPLLEAGSTRHTRMRP
jgi:hypothetical protein